MFQNFNTQIKEIIGYLINRNGQEINKFYLK